MTFRHSLLFLLILTSLFSCKEIKKEQYIYIGHSYDWKAENRDRVDPRIDSMDLSKYDQIWLGGDLCSRTSQKATTLAYLDNIFQLSKPTTHWSIGNHDLKKGNPAFITQHTKRPLSYSHHDDGITYFIMNTNLGHPQVEPMDSTLLCEALHRQINILHNITDTIKNSAYLVVLHHHGLLTKKLVEGRMDIIDKWHLITPSLPFDCAPHSTFEELVYPMLTTIQRKGVQVILVGGDIGQRAKKFEYKTKEGIWFLGSGINNSMDPNHVPKYVKNMNPDSILVFEYDLRKRKLDWSFFEL